MSKSLGQVAYEAHTPDYRVQWDDLWLGHRRSWQAAAEAVMAAEVEPYKERDAVIEAAKSFMNWCRDTPEYERDYRLLEEAVDALEELQKAERERQ